MNTVLKAACLAIYALAILALFQPFPGGVVLQWLALALLAGHLLELLLFFRHVRKYPGSLATSVLLTLLFGLLHWQPLMKKAG